MLDACASGAITRLKGGRPQPPFLVDESASMRGHAILTSSAATEAAQESDRIRGSYFTHFLVSGLRGAADLSGEGKVTLNEAYQFAFGETLGRTVESRGGPQHPSYDISLSGTGDVVMTDLRQTSATLVIGESVDGRCFVRNARQELVVELYKPLGRTVELGVEPGAYEVRVERTAAVLLARPELKDGARVVLDGGQFTATSKEATQPRGGPAAAPLAVAGRNRLDLRYTRFLAENLALTIGAHSLAATSGTAVSASGVTAGDSTAVAIPLGLRFCPLPGGTRAVKPYLDVALGPVIGATSGTSVSARGTYAGDSVEVVVGGLLGGGVDFHLSRGFSLGVSAGYQWTDRFAQPVGGRTDYSGFELALNIGWLFGKGSAPRE